MRLADALRGLLAATNDKAYRSPADQERVIEAQAALAEYDRGEGRGFVVGIAITDAVPVRDVAAERASFLDAMTWAAMP